MLPLSYSVRSHAYVLKNLTSEGDHRLARNSDIDGVVDSVKQMEDRFNKKFRYDYVLLNEQPFGDKFK